MKVVGRVVDSRTPSDSASRMVEAWDKDLLCDDCLGRARVGPDGRFVIEFDERSYRRGLFDRFPDLYFKVYDGDRLLVSTEDTVLWNARRGPTEVLIELGEESSCGTPPEPAEPVRPGVVEGRVLTDQGHAASALRMELWDRSLAGEQLLARAVTDADGRYALRYDLAALVSKSRADLLVRVCDPRRNDTLAESDVFYQASPALVVDLVVPDEVVDRPAEYRRLLAALEPLLGTTALSALEPQGIEYLARRSGWDARLIAMAARAAQLAAETGIAEPHYYALLRDRWSSDAQQIHALPASVVMHVLETAIEQGVIDGENAVGDTLERFRTHASAALEVHRPHGAVSSLGEMLDLSLDRAAKAAFLATCHATGAEPSALWPALAEAGLGEDLVARLKVDGKLGCLTGQNAPLVARLRDVAGVEQPEDLPRAGLYQAEAWKALISVDVPSDVSIDAYARGLAAQVAQAFPNLVAAEMVHRRELDVASDGKDRGEELVDFLRASHGASRLGVDAVRTWSGFAELSPQARQGALLVERIYQMSPSNESMAVLAKQGLHSAYAVAKMPREAFLAAHGEAFQTRGEAELVYRKAAEILATTMQLATGALVEASLVTRQALAGQLPERPMTSSAHSLPSFQRLLGDLNYCECEHCRSVLSPAAYFVELLEFLDGPGENTPLSVLLDRRPDLELLQLSCENTNVVLPVIDIVNEILEHVAAKNGSVNGFLGRDIDEQMAVEDLLADPHMVASEAYERTGSEVYPPSLPFDMPLEAMRLLMQAWGTSLAEALDLVGLESAARREQLRLGSAQYAILTDHTYRKLAEYFGEDGETTLDALDQTIGVAATFCERMSCSYIELAELLRTESISPGAALVPRVGRLGVSLEALYAWLEGASDDASFEKLISEKVRPEDFDGDVLTWLRARRSQILDMILLRATGAQGQDQFATLRLRRAPPVAPADRLSAIDYLRLVRFIRLWRSLGWSIVTVDRLAVTLLAGRPRSQDFEQLDAEYIELLSSVANLLRVVRRASRSSRSEGAIGEQVVASWLPIWDISIDEASRLMLLARQLRVHLAELKTLSALIGVDPLARDLASSTPSVMRLVDALDSLRSLGLKVADVDYLLRHRDDGGRIAPTPHEIDRQVLALVGALAAVDAELGEVPNDADLAYLFARLSRVYDEATLDRVGALVGGTRRFETPFVIGREALPAPLEGVLAELHFDPLRQVLSHAGVVTTTSVSRLVGAAQLLVATDLGPQVETAERDVFVSAFIAAVEALRSVCETEIAQLAVEHPKLAALVEAYAEAEDPAASLRSFVVTALGDVRPELARAALYAALMPVLRLDRATVEALVSDAAVLHAQHDAVSPVIEDLTALGDAVTFATTGTTSFYLVAPSTGRYILYVIAPAATNVGLEVDGQVAIPQTEVDSSGEVSSVGQVFELEAGVVVSARLVVSALAPGGSVQLLWRTDQLSRAAIPTARMLATARLDAARASMVRLTKAALLIRAAGLTPSEVQVLASHVPETRGLLNDLAVETAASSPTVAAAWRKLAWLGWFMTLRRRDPHADASARLLREPGLRRADGGYVLAGVHGWQSTELELALVHLGLEIGALASLEAMRRVVDLLDLSMRLAVPLPGLLKCVVAAPSAATVEGAKEVLRARDPRGWRATLQNVNDTLRNKRRDALVTFILHHARPDDSVVTAESLYEYLLIDVQVDACMRTSRIRQAISTVQLFITRCLMGLEPRVPPAAIRADEWHWMRRYRVWEASRRIFLFPENWLEPGLRDDKSPLFRELESELLKADVTDALAEEAYLNYLRRLDEIARPEILAAYLEEAASEDEEDGVLHVFARTNGTPHQFFYRRYEAGFWRPWEKITLEIQSDQLLPVVWRGQLMLFWVKSSVEPKAPDASKTPRRIADEASGDNAGAIVELHLSWGEYHRGRWTSQKGAELPIRMRLTDEGMFDPGDLALGALTSQPMQGEPERLVVSIQHPIRPSSFTLEFVSKHTPPGVVKDDDPRLAEIWQFTKDLFWARNSERPPNARIRRRASHLAVQVFVQQPGSAPSTTAAQTLMTRTRPVASVEATDGDGWQLQTLNHPVSSRWKAPLFYSDRSAVFVLTPRERVEMFLEFDGYFGLGREVEQLNRDVLVPLPEGDVIPPVPGPVPRVARGVTGLQNDARFVYHGAEIDARGLAREDARR